MLLNTILIRAIYTVQECLWESAVADPGSGRGGPNIFPEILPTKQSEPILARAQGPP